MSKRIVRYALTFALAAIAWTIPDRALRGGDWWLDVDFVILIAALGALYGWRSARPPED